MEKENKSLKEDIKVLVERNNALDSELEAKIMATRNSKRPCDGCPKLKEQLDSLKQSCEESEEIIRNQILELETLRNKVAELTRIRTETERELYHAKFVKEKTDASNSTEKILIEVQNRLQSAEEKNSYLESKVELLEKKPKNEDTWYRGQKAHDLWLRQAQGNHYQGPRRTPRRKIAGIGNSPRGTVPVMREPSGSSSHAYREQKPRNNVTKRYEAVAYSYSTKPNRKSKYVDLPANRLCMFCGKSGHLTHDCIHKAKVEQKNFIYVKKQDDSVALKPKRFRMVWVPKKQN